MTDTSDPDLYATPVVTATPAPYEPPVGYVLTPAPAPRSQRLGQVALLVAIVVFVGTIVVSILIGIAAGPFAVHNAGGFHYSFDIGSSNPTESALAVATLLQWSLGSALGIWALVQGIVAAATRRGRAFGVVAIVLSALGPLATGVATLVAVGMNLH
jgi:hypothetical protein